MKSILYDVIDISSYQKNIVDVEKLKSKVGGVILRLGYTGYESEKPTMDKYFMSNYAKCREAGIPVGVYYFTLAYNEAMVKMETDWILSTINNLHLELPVFLDCEGQKNSAPWTACTCQKRTDCAILWLDTINKAGYYVGVYGSKAKFTNSTFLDNSRLTKYDHWVAQYNDAIQETTYKGQYNMWQYTSSGKPADYGVEGSSVDVSHCYVDYPTIMKSKGLNRLVPETEQGSTSESETQTEPKLIKTITIEVYSDGTTNYKETF